MPGGAISNLPCASIIQILILDGNSDIIKYYLDV